MIPFPGPFPGNARIWIAMGQTDMRRGMDALARQVQHGLGRDPHSGDLYLFRGRQGDLIKILWADDVGLSRYPPRNWPVCSMGSTGDTRARRGDRCLSVRAIKLR
jgi:transposase